jgi:hypothetical protein
MQKASNKKNLAETFFEDIAVCILNEEQIMKAKIIL